MRALPLLIVIVLWPACRSQVRQAPSPASERAEALFQRALLPAGSWYPHDVERAIDLLDSAILLAPAHFDAHRLKALLLDELARPRAADAYHAAAALRPYDPVLLRTVGCHHLSHGDSAAAHTWFLRAEAAFATDAMPVDSLPWQHLVDRGTNLMLLGRTGEGRALLDIAFATAPDRPGRDLVDHLRALPPRIMAHALLPDREAVLRAYRAW
ncbi:MAG: hypothetical protein RBT71_13920 [Flavobacteriales bacterium]|jgi:tetratricopeptide (TPR) repeat protein|nr:hypothetical protein [Flavobacteriales bacterium]